MVGNTSRNYILLSGHTHKAPSFIENKHRLLAHGKAKNRQGLKKGIFTE